MSRISIRMATVEDADIVAELFSELNAQLGADGLDADEARAPKNVMVSGDQMARRMRSMAGLEHVFVAETAAGPAGLCCLRLMPYIGQDVPYAEVTQLYVRSRHQRQGIGAALIREAEAKAEASFATCVHIITGNDNLGAQAFYLAQGYSSETLVFDKYFDREASHA